MKKVFFIIMIFIAIFLIYNKEKSNKIVYVALGDSLAQGITPYGSIGYSYTDYLAENLKTKQTLKYYTKSYAKIGYNTEDIINQIRNNVSFAKNNKKYYIKELLRSADLVTISIGFDEFFDNIEQQNQIINSNMYKKMDNTSLEITNLIKLVKKYAKGTIILVGYYNPILKGRNNSENIDKYIRYSDILFQKICKNNNIQFVKISDIFKQNSNFISNPLDIHPNNMGYIAIYNEINTLIEKKDIIDL